MRSNVNYFDRRRIGNSRSRQTWTQMEGRVGKPKRSKPGSTGWRSHWYPFNNSFCQAGRRGRRLASGKDGMSPSGTRSGRAATGSRRQRYGRDHRLSQSAQRSPVRNGSPSELMAGSPMSLGRSEKTWMSTIAALLRKNARSTSGSDDDDLPARHQRSSFARELFLTPVGRVTVFRGIRFRRGCGSGFSFRRWAGREGNGFILQGIIRDRLHSRAAFSISNSSRRWGLGRLESFSRSIRLPISEPPFIAMERRVPLSEADKATIEPLRGPMLPLNVSLARLLTVS